MRSNFKCVSYFFKIKLSVLTVFFTSVSFSQTFTDSNLPIFIINTPIDPITNEPIEIPDDPKIWADLKIIYRPDGSRNYVSDQNNPEFLNFNNRIKIELRGTSSQWLEKKQFGWTTYNNEGDKEKVSLLGMPSENDWILNGLAYDASLIRDYLNYNLVRQMGQYATRTRFCEVIINGDYRGLYMLTEKVKDGPNRVNIEDISPEDNSGINLTGGYMTQADRGDEEDPVAWQMSSHTGLPADYIHVLPKSEDVTPEQNDYIHNVFLGLETTSANKNHSYINGYPSIIDVPTFIDFMIINEFASNVDAYQLSTYFHKDRGGKLRAGPVWDFNLSLGLDVFGNRSNTNVWQFNNGDNEGSKFWKDLFNDDAFRCHFAKRWKELTKVDQPLNYSKLLDYIDETEALISEAAQRNGQRWGFEVDTDFAYHINELKNWIGQRISWIDANIGSANACDAIEIPELVISKIHYNPNESADFQESDDQEFIEITNVGNTAVDLTGVYFSKLGISYSFPAGATIYPKHRIHIASDSIVFQSRYGIPAFGQFVRNLSNKNQKLELADAMGNVIDFVEYFAESPWPDANGNGYYLELNSLDLDNNLASSWKTSESKLSVFENPSDSNFVIFPNPVADKFYIISENIIDQVSLFDITGKLIYNEKLDSKSTQIDINYFSSGVYFLKIKSNVETKDFKIIKK